MSIDMPTNHSDKDNYSIILSDNFRWCQELILAKTIPTYLPNKLEKIENSQ